MSPTKKEVRIIPNLIDLTGNKYGRLKVLSRDTSRKGTYWICQCACENIVSVKAYNLTSGSTKSCGCLNTENIHQKRRNSIDLTGRRYGDLEVIEYACSNRNGTQWRCKCHRCGGTTVVTAAWLKHNKSCGCAASDAATNAANRYKNVIQETGTNPERFLNNAPNKNSKTGIKGICYLVRTDTYVAYITFQGQRKTLKKSKKIEECISARKEAESHLDDFLRWYEENYKK